MLVRKAKETKITTLHGALGEIRKFDNARWSEIIENLSENEKGTTPSVADL
jgi:hypothetical protein